MSNVDVVHVISYQTQLIYPQYIHTTQTTRYAPIIVQLYQLETQSIQVQGFRPIKDNHIIKAQNKTHKSMSK